MEILLSPETARRLREHLAGAGAHPVDRAVRLTRLPGGDWHVAIAAPEPTDHRGLIEDVPFAVEAAAAEEAKQVLVAWSRGQFMAGPLARHGCHVDTEVRE